MCSAFTGGGLGDVFSLQDVGQFHSAVCTVDHSAWAVLFLEHVRFVSDTQRDRAVGRQLDHLCVSSVQLSPLLTDR